MKSLMLNLLALSLVAVAAKADHLGTKSVYMNSSRIINLSECHGSASVRAEWSQLVLTVSGNDNCTNVVVNGQTFKAEELWGSRSITVRVPLSYGYNSTSVIVKSNTGKTQDRFTITVNKENNNYSPAPVLGDDDWVRLSNCGGWAKFDVQNGQANLKLKSINLNKCDSITLYDGQGNVKRYSLNSESSSFTVPKRFVDYGSNTVKVYFTTNSGYRVDDIRLKFKAY